MISRELMVNAIKKLKRCKGSPDGCTAEVYHALPPSARNELLTGLQELFDTLSFPSEWTEISATLIPQMCWLLEPEGLQAAAFTLCHSETSWLCVDDVCAA